MSFPERWVKEVLPERRVNPRHHRIHIIKSLSYRQAISWGGFFSYKHERNHVEKYEHFFKDYHEHDYESDMRMASIMRVEVTWEFIEHEDLYAFYDYIGYDRHTKKFKEGFYDN